MAKALYVNQPISLIIICVEPYKNISELMLFYQRLCSDYFTFLCEDPE